MKSVWQNLHKLADKLRMPDLPNWMLGLLVVVLLLRVPSFFEPYYYGDEMVYLTLGQGVRQGQTLYKDLHDNKPPLLYLTAAAAGNLFWFKAILAFWSIATIIVFYNLAKHLFEDNEKTQKISMIIFAALTTLPLLEGNTVNAELFMIGFIILASLKLLRDKLTAKTVFIAGVLFGLAALFKIPASFDLPAIIAFWVITADFKKDWKDLIKNIFIVAAGFATPILLTMIWYYFSGALPEYIKAAFLQNVGYLSSFRPGDVQKPFLVRNAPMLIRALVVLSGALIVWFNKNKLSKRFILLTLWILFSLFAVTLSERPYPHYFVQVVAPLSLFFGMLFTEKSFEQVLAIIPLAVALFVPVYYKFYFYPTTTYYARFINFATGRINRSTYFSQFSTNTNRNYQIADFIAMSSRTSDRVFMWDQDSAAVYALSKRLPPIKYTVPYHVNDYSNMADVAKQIIKLPPKFIILTAGNPYPQLSGLIRQNYILVQQIGDAQIYSRVDLVSRL